MEHILTINAGSSSIKFGLFEAGTEPKKILWGCMENIGLEHTTFSIQSAETESPQPQPVDAANLSIALPIFISLLKEHLAPYTIVAIGHRIVHGGATHAASIVITPTVIEDIRQLTHFAPNHLPAEIALIEALQQTFPHVPQVACFDTAFHHDLPRKAQIIPIPRSHESKGLRAYGFHGISYQFLMQRLHEIGGAAVAESRVVLAHLGNGASLAAVSKGAVVDTTMGFSPASGIPMSTRSGSIDPGIVNYFLETEKMSAQDLSTLLTERSGLLGMSETSADMRQLLDQEATDIRSREAIDVFCYHIQKTIGAYAAAMGGIDTLVFSGGIGMRAPKVRSRICENLVFLGIAIDAEKNNAGALVISVADKPVTIYVIATDEEHMIASDTARIYAASSQ